MINETASTILGSLPLPQRTRSKPVTPEGTHDLRGLTKSNARHGQCHPGIPYDAEQVFPSTVQVLTEPVPNPSSEPPEK